VDCGTYGVIFDMDGVLADTAPQHFQSWQAIEPHLGVRVSYDDFRIAFGRPNHEGIPILLHREVTPEELKEIDRLKEAAFRDIARKSLKPLPGVVRLIKELSASGFRLAVGSSGPRENIEMVLDALGVASYFGAIVSGWDVTRGKPDPEVFLKAAARIRVDPPCCVVLEDVPVGIEAAHAAGMKCIAVTTTRPAEDLRSADRVVESIEEVSAADVAAMLDTV
jgi:beta-phosphoglucomutase